MDSQVSRRTLLQLGAGGLALLATGSGLAPPAAASGLVASGPGGAEPWVEGTVAQLQRLMRRGTLSSSELTAAYLGRISALNPVLNAVLETNPDALAIARRRDRERRQGRVRGPLHGIPVLLKDNIATADRMETTAGSLALVGSLVPEDAPLVRRLRSAGAVVLGKTNLSEWANFRGGNPEFPPINGWSGRGGFTRNPVDLGLDPSGSSSGSGAAAAASLATLTVGTETDGSILSPSAEQAVVGIKPTVGLVPGGGIIPIAHSQDAAGPICRTVRDAALLLDTLRRPGRRLHGHRLPHSYADHLDRHALRGARLAFDRRYVDGDYGPGDPEVLDLVGDALDELRRAGATVVDVTSVDPAQPDRSGRVPFDDEFTVLLFEFKVQIAEYLSQLQRTSMRTLADLIAFNRANCATELKWFGQEVFELAEATSGDLGDPEYRAALATSQGFGRGVIDRFRAQDFDAVVIPSGSFGTTVAATAGYPSMSVPAGYLRSGRPVGLWLAAGHLEEARLIRIGYAIEQTLRARTAPTLAGTVPPDPKPFPGCATGTTQRQQRVGGRADAAAGLRRREL